MKKLSKSIIVLLLVLCCSLSYTSAYFNSSSRISNVYKTEKYTFKLSGSGGVFSADDIIVNKGKTTLPTPTKRGYNFLGYSSSSNGNVDYSNVINNVNSINDKTIYAKWGAQTYNISYALNGGSISGQKTSYTIEDTFTLPIPTKTGYDFVGWTGTGLNNATKNVTIKGEVGNRNYSANWNATTYSIGYNLNGGSISGQKTSYTIEDTFTLPTPTRKGYDFVGWTGTGLSGATKNVTIKGNTGNKSYTANWSATTYSISYNLNGGSISGQKTSYNIEQSFTLPTPTRTGYTFVGWTGSNGSSKQTSVSVSKGTTGNLSYTANWNINTYVVDVNPIIHNTSYNSGLSGFTFSVWLNGSLVADHVTDYYNGAIPYGTKLRVYVYDRDGYSVTSFRDNTWTVTSSFNISPTWYDNIPPTITSFSVTNHGFYDPNKGAKAGWNISIYINGYDNGTGIQKYQTWLVPYGNGSGSPRQDGASRYLTNVLYLDTAQGRTFCAYAIDNAGNEAEKCATIYD